MITDDPTLYASGYARIEGDRYFTHPWMTDVLLDVLPTGLLPDTVWEPAVGRGDIARRLIEKAGVNIVASDVDLSEYDASIGPAHAMSFIDCDTEEFFDPAVFSIGAVITNPPYARIPGKRMSLAEGFARQALKFDGVKLVAMLLRSEFGSAAGRTDLFTEQPFAFEIKMTTRPRWDWWRDEKLSDNGPRHSFSWFVWHRDWDGPCTTYWRNRKDVESTKKGVM